MEAKRTRARRCRTRLSKDRPRDRLLDFGASARCVWRRPAGEARLAIERGRIAAILERERSERLRVAPRTTIAPGLIDVHTNGADDLLFNRDQGNAVDVATRAYARMGATGFVAG